MLRSLLVGSLMLAAIPALAQSTAPEPAALGAELLECVTGKVQLRSRTVQQDAQVASLTAEVTRLKDELAKAAPAAPAHEAPAPAAPGHGPN